MKKSLVLIIALSLSLYSCSNDDSINNEETNQDVDNTPEFAMTARINGDLFQANSPLGTNEFSNTNIFSRFPIEEFVLIQGTQGGGFNGQEIDIWLKRSDIEIGSYTVDADDYGTPPSHFIDLIDNSNNIYENTNGGIITITEVNTTSNIVVGTFGFTTVEFAGNPDATPDFIVTDGTFRYIYQ